MANSSFDLSVIISAVDRFTAPMRRMTQGMNRLTSPIRRVRAAFSNMMDAAGVQRLNAAIGNVTNRVMGLGGAVRSVALRFSVIAALGAGSMGALITSVANAGDEVAKFSDRIGVNVEWLQSMRYGAEQSGVSADAFGTAMQRMGRRSAEFAMTGSGAAAGAFKQLGISVTDSEGRLKGVEELLPEVADKLSMVRSESARNAMAMQLFDTEGVALVNMLRDGSAGLEEFERRARELGIANEQLARDSENYTSAAQDTRDMLRGFQMMLATELIPVLTTLHQQFQDWLTGLRESGAFQEFVEGIRDGMPTFEQITDWLGTMRERLQPLTDAFTWATDTFGTMETILGILAVTIGGPVITAIAMLAGSLVSLGIALLTTPVGWFLGAIALIAGAAYLIYDNWGAITEWWGNLWAGIAAAFEEGFINGILNLLATFNPLAPIQRAIQAVLEWILGPDVVARTEEAGAGIINSITSGIASGVDATIEFFRDLILSLVEIVPELLGAFVEVGSRIVDAIGEGISAAWSGLTGWFRDRISSLTDMIPDWMKFGGSAEVTQNFDYSGSYAPAASGRVAGALELHRRHAETASGQSQRSESHVTVEFENAPRGTQVSGQTNGATELDMRMGYSMMNP